MTESELGTPLGPGEPKKQEELKFTDYSINKFQSDFSSGRKKIRTKIENSGLKGLKISQSKTTKKNTLYKISGLTISLTIGLLENLDLMFMELMNVEKR